MTRGAVLRLLAAAGLLTVVLAPPAQAVPHAITIANYAFSPADDTITQGDSVTWTNTDQAPHDVTVTSGPAAIHSPTITTGQSWTYTFTTPGTYSYICSIHPDMHATLVVTPAPAPTTHAAAPPPVPTRMVVVPTRTAVPAPPQVTPLTTAPSAAAMAAPGQPPTPTTPAAQAAAQDTPELGLNPLLLVAGLVAAVATLCLLLLGSRPEKQQD
jgi:plastocyanin